MIVRARTAGISIVLGSVLIVLAFQLDRVIMIDQEPMLALMLALAPAGVFLVFEGVLTLWRDARLRAVEPLEKP
jgi:chromate transport protein ChrA